MKSVAAIELKDLSFAYNGSPIMSDVNLQIESGRLRQYRWTKRWRQNDSPKTLPWPS